MHIENIYLVFIFGTLIFIAFAFFLILFLIHHKRKQQHYLEEKLQLEHQYQSQLLQTRLEVQEQAFTYLSEEIHDNVGQALSTVKLQLYAIHNNASEENKPLITTTTAVLSKAINDLRNISHNLHGGYISEQGLQEAIENEVAYINGAKTVKIVVEKKGESYSLGKEKELLVFRIVQEAINNTIKHADADNIKITIEYLPRQFCVSIADNGKGMDITKESNSGLGLKNMQTRASLLQAIFNVESSSKGTTITLLLTL